MIKKNRKSSRYRYFSLSLFVDIVSKSDKIWSDIQQIIHILKLVSFISQRVLEKTLYNLTIKENGREIFLEDFYAQLESDPTTGLPFWKIALKTTSATTGRRITESVCESLNYDKSAINKNIKIKSTNQLEKFLSDSRVVLRDTEWFPGHFTKSTILFMNLLNKTDVQEMIKDGPIHYENIYIQSLGKKEPS